MDSKVSILTRAFARVQPPSNWRGASSSRQFQSSLELSPECNKTGVCERGRLPEVSILTRAFARVQPPGSRPLGLAGGQFQSSLELSPECNRCTNLAPQGDVGVSILTRAFARVQPPAHRRGFPVSPVSILTRAFARVQPIASHQVGSSRSRFQSSLELSPECNQVFLINPAYTSQFQSSLELSPECNLRPQGAGLVEAPVSILTRAFARVQRVPGEILAGAAPVSILTRAFARVQHPQTHRAISGPACFNPHSSFRPSAT